jgi:hypothetical protein
MSTGKGDLFNIISIEPEFFSVLIILLTRNTIKEFDNLDVSFSKESTNLNGVFVDFNFNGEMLLDDMHFISETFGNTLDHIFDMSSDGEENG